LDVDLYKAYSGAEAIEILSCYKMDIVLCDIRMPGISGMELAEKIRATWPECRIIFLTGYNEFDYIYTATKHEGVYYLLKTENDDVIVETVLRALNELEKSYLDKLAVEKAKHLMTNALPLMQREFVNGILDGSASMDTINEHQLEELDLKINLQSPTYLLLARVDGISEDMPSVNREKLHFAIKIISQRYLHRTQQFIFTVFNKNVLVWLFQALEPQVSANEENPNDCSIIKFIYNCIEDIQQSCRQTLGLTLSFAADDRLISWCMIFERFSLLKQLLYYPVGVDKESITSANGQLFAELIEHQDKDHFFQRALQTTQKIHVLEEHLQLGHREAYFSLLSDMTEYLSTIRIMNNTQAKEIYLSIALMLVSYINRWSLVQSLSSQIDLNLITAIDEHESWHKAVSYIESLSTLILDIQCNDKDQRVSDAMQHIMQHIEAHLSEDISLTKLAETVHFHPSYLSRMFHQAQGYTLTDYIFNVRIEKTKNLLKTTNLKVQEISKSVGFDSAAYFSRFFKRATGKTAQEYRDLCHKVE
jgi:two-component system response regulator YesN